MIFNVGQIIVRVVLGERFCAICANASRARQCSVLQSNAFGVLEVFGGSVVSLLSVFESSVFVGVAMCTAIGMCAMGTAGPLTLRSEDSACSRSSWFVGFLFV